MCQRTKRRIAVSSVLFLVLCAGALGVLVALRATRAAAQALPDVGPFRAGAALGEERAGFSGRPQVKVFTSAASAEWPEVAAALQDTAVLRAMAGFTGVLIDPPVEPEVEPVLRERDGLQVVVRGLEGAFLGGLKSVTAGDLAALLETISAHRGKPPEPSPLYARLLESPEPIDVMLRQGERALAERSLAFLRELEGAGSPAVQAVEARLAR